MHKKKKKCSEGLSVKNQKNYLVCKTSQETRARLEKAAKIEKRSISNLVCIVVEAWLDDNEIEV